MLSKFHYVIIVAIALTVFTGMSVNSLAESYSTSGSMGTRTSVQMLVKLQPYEDLTRKSTNAIYENELKEVVHLLEQPDLDLCQILERLIGIASDFGKSDDKIMYQELHHYCAVYDML